jgi:hypothetical protein
MNYTAIIRPEFSAARIMFDRAGGNEFIARFYTDVIADTTSSMIR